MRNKNFGFVVVGSCMISFGGLVISQLLLFKQCTGCGKLTVSQL